MSPVDMKELTVHNGVSCLEDFTSYISGMRLASISFWEILQRGKFEHQAHMVINLSAVCVS